MLTNKKAFTLIELLVVVLIIGILAAVALPQYKVAVMKSRLVAQISIVKAMKQAAEAYYLANGQYVDDVFAYDVDYPNCDTSQTSNCKSGNWQFEVISGNGEDVSVSLMKNSGYAIICYGMYLDRSTHPGRIYCGAANNDETANKVCKAMGGVNSFAGSCLGGKNVCNMYVLP